MAPPLVRFEHADIGYGSRPILRDVTCSIEKGESVGLVGPNGSGKTTFLKSVLGLAPCLSGRLEVDRSGRFAYVPQSEELNFFWPLTLTEMVRLPARARRFWGAMDEPEKRSAEKALEKVGLSARAGMLFRDGSGGQRQRAVLAQALFQDPEVLLMDEPTRGLDMVAERDLLHLIQTLKSKKLTLFLVTHQLSIPLNFAEKILVFKGGAVIETTSDELIHTKKLEDIYGVPFVYHEEAGVRWAAPIRHP